jgi:hypothetical protein
MKILCTILFLFFVVDSSAQPVTATIFSTKKIWEQAPHNAFTDLIRFQGKFYCVFREGDRHVEGEGKLRVLTSTDGARWESAALLEEKGRDLRDAKISITPDGRLMLNGGSADPIDHSPTGSFHSVVSFSRDGRNWTPIQQINFANPKENRNWLWRVVWNKGTAYGVAYQADPASPANQRQFYAFVVKSRDGINFARISEDFAEGTEAALSFDKNDVLTILLRGRSNRTKAFVVQAPAPYKSWTKREITADFGDDQVGGPALLFPDNFTLPHGVLLGAGRRFQTKPGPEQRTGLFLLDVNNATLTHLLLFPSGGDTSYPGLVWHKDKLWVSYYSSHEGKSAIYLAQVKLTKK